MKKGEGRGKQERKVMKKRKSNVVVKERVHKRKKRNEVKGNLNPN